MAKEEKVEKTKNEEKAAKLAVPDCFGVLFDDGEDCRACKLFEDCKETTITGKIEEAEADELETAESEPEDERVPDEADIEDPDSGIFPVGAEPEVPPAVDAIEEDTPPAAKPKRKKSVMLETAYFKVDGNKSDLLDDEKDANLILRKGDKVRVNNKRSKFHGQEAVFGKYSLNWNECPLDFGGKHKANIKPHHLEVVND